MKQSSISTDRWNYIDLMEFIGIFFVLIYHSTTYSCSWIEDGTALSFLRYYLRTILSTCVPLFFFVNGYLLFNRSFNLKKHIIKMIKIICLTGFWGIITIILLVPIENNYLSLIDFVIYLLSNYEGLINHLWYMGALICIYIFFPLLKITFDSNKKIFVYFTIICAILTFGNVFIGNCASMMLNVFKLHNGIVSSNFFSIFNPFRGINGYTFVYFCVGGLAYELKEKIEKINKKKRILTATSILVFSCLGLFITGILLSNISGMIWDVVWYGYDTIFTFINVVMIFVLCLSYKGENKLIRSISSNTLGIYFMHVIFIRLTNKYVVQIPIIATFFGCIVYAFIIMIICLIITKLLLKIPLLKELVKL